MHNDSTSPLLPMTERQLMDGLISAARRLNLLVYHTHMSRHSEAGFPDLCIVGNGRIAFMECKGPKGKLSEPQRTWIIQLQAAGIDAFAVYPADYDMAIDYLQGWAP